MSDPIVSDVYIDVAPIEMDVELQNRAVDKKHYNITISNVIGDVDEDGVYQFPRNTGVFVGMGIKEIPSYGLYYKFYNSGISEFHMPDLEIVGEYGLSLCFQGGKVGVVDMPKLSRCGDFCMRQAFRFCPVEEENVFLNFTELSGLYIANEIFYLAKLKKTSLVNIKRIQGTYTLNSAYQLNRDLLETGLNNLEEIFGANVCQSMFSGCEKLTTTGLVRLRKIMGNRSCAKMFAGCTSLTKEYFYNLVEIELTNALEDMFLNCDNLTEIHFRREIQSVVEGLVGYDNKFGAPNAQIIFDL